MNVRKTPKQIIPELCKHEAGHFVIARELGFKTDGCKIKVDWNGGYEGGCTIMLPAALTSIPLTLNYLERRAKVLYAGSLDVRCYRGSRLVPYVIESLVSRKQNVA